MKYRYTKFTGDALDELDLEDLVSKLSDLLLSSGFGNPHGHNEEERTMQALHDAILDALFNGGVLPEETIERLLGDPGRRRSGRRALEARGADPADHRADGRRGLHHGAAGSGGRARAAPGTRRRPGSGPAAGHLRGHRQDARLPRLSRAARSARVARQEQLRPPRHARAGDRRRDDRRAEAVRVRRHAEPRSGEHAAQRRPARGARTRGRTRNPQSSPQSAIRDPRRSTSRTRT